MELAILFLILKISLLLLVVLWVSIGSIMFYRKRRIRKLHLIEDTFAEVVSNYLYPDKNNPVSLIEIQRLMRKIGIRESKMMNVQYLITLMIRTQRSILGKNHDRLKQLYTQIPPYRASISKVRAYGWYNKACGIREIYEMNQTQYLQEILPLRNHKNLYVRREAQIALVVFMGWDSLRFIPYLKQKITLWQQIKIVEKLYDLYKEPQVESLRRIYGSDKVFAKQLIMRIVRKYGLVSEIDYILSHLDHSNYEVREAAIYCLNSFKLNTQIEYIKSVFQKIPVVNQQRQLMDYIYQNSEIDLNFYMNLLRTSNDEIKLKSAEILWNNGYKENVQEFYLQQYSNSGVHAE
ncbi:hypothetical protein RM549_00915 [Salegentibacter sp. F188]|uniref:HEAT repeat domain-containing protein n=1 Tax=Autumnicola patrickiae TaxID=3075591 RepID=A0ABU3DX65_9FLAO|nr:hypothetical protein [Salegentibacter sp. F188]MDT0688328.1 hypothetical protein [Salegentibacter sp. F188]